MKIIYRIPTEQYAYVEMEQTIDKVVETSQLRQTYEELKAAFAPKPENMLGDKEFTDFIYASIHKLGNHAEVWETMHPLQQKFIRQMGNAMGRKKPETKIAGVDFKKNLEALDDLTF